MINSHLFKKCCFYVKEHLLNCCFLILLNFKLSDKIYSRDSSLILSLLSAWHILTKTTLVFLNLLNLIKQIIFFPFNLEVSFILSIIYIYKCICSLCLNTFKYFHWQKTIKNILIKSNLDLQKDQFWFKCLKSHLPKLLGECNTSIKVFVKFCKVSSVLQLSVVHIKMLLIKTTYFWWQ